MADSGAERAARARAHRRGDHSLCVAGRCPAVEAVGRHTAARPVDTALVVAAQEEVAGLPAALQGSTRAAAVLLLAGLLAGAPAREAATLSKELRATLAELQKAAQAAPEEVDPVDELAQRRERRRAAASAHSAGGQLSS